MSMCYNIQCDDCKKVLWVGQRDYIYSSKEHLKAFAKFLHDHINHELKFVNDENIEDDYEDVSPED